MDNKSQTILILGDGNFSFTLSLVKRLVSYGINTNIVATSYDSYEELCRKYPEFLNIKNKLNSYEQVRIVHNINATTLQQYNILESYCYNEIIFNFPHLSKEDCNAHYSLLCHTMYRCKDLMNEGTTLSIALAEAQGVRWKILEAAEKNGMKLFFSQPIFEEEWPDYELKRHHTGKSFKRKIEKCKHYLFRKSSSSDVGVPLLKLLKQCYERNRIVQSDSMSTTSSNTSSRDKQVNPIDESVVAVIRKNEKFKKRKMHCSVQGLYFTRNPDRIENSCYPLEQSWECSVCKKVFPSEQGVRTHVYLMHVINQSGAEESSSSTVAFLQDYVCVTCDRKFSNSDALYQHQRARHSVGIRDNSLKESDSMAVQSANSVEKLEYSVVCAICDYAFESVVHLEEHMRQGLIPITPVAFNVCKNCGRNFADRRAMEQHVKFCVN